MMIVDEYYRRDSSALQMQRSGEISDTRKAIMCSQDSIK